MKNYNINTEAAKIPAVSSCKIDKYEYRTGEEVLPSSQSQSQSKYRRNQIYIPSSRKNVWKKKKIKDAAEKQRGTIEEAAEKQKKYLQTLNTDQQLQLIDDLFTKNFLTTEAKDELA